MADDGILCCLFQGFVGELGGFPIQKATDFAVKLWKDYTQSSYDLQDALRSACLKAASTLAIGLAPEEQLQKGLRLPITKLRREYVDMLDARYIQPFCTQHANQAQPLRQQAKAQCARLSTFFKTFPFHDLSAKEIATLVYNTRFVTSIAIFQDQTRLTKTALQREFSKANLSPEFIAFLVFPDDGAGILFDSILYFFEEEIKTNQRVSAILARFDQHVVLQEIQSRHADAQQKLSDLQAQIAKYESQGQFDQIPKIAGEAQKLEKHEQQMKKLMGILTQNAEVCQRLDAQVADVHAALGSFNRNVADHFESLQTWLHTELEAVKDDLKAHASAQASDLKAHVSSEASEIKRLIHQELSAFMGARDEIQVQSTEACDLKAHVASAFMGARDTIQVQSTDFLRKSYKLWDRYEQIELLGQGGLAQVYKARKGELGTVALKVLHQKHQHDRPVVARFLAEGKIMGILGDAPGHTFAKVREMGQTEDGYYFLEIDFIAGQSLQHYLKTRKPFTPPEVLQILRQLASALRYAHEHQIIHRDIKPQNIIYSGDQRVTLIDFGIAKRLDHQTAVTTADAFYGTFQYAAPEQFGKRFGQISERTDVYALGILGYHLLLGKFPFDAETEAEYIHAHCYDPLPAIPESIPPRIAKLIERCAQKQPSDRFENMPAVEAYIDGIDQQDAIDEYAESFRPFAESGTIPPKQRAVLERYRRKLGLGTTVIAQIEERVRQACQEQSATDTVVPNVDLTTPLNKSEQPFTPAADDIAPGVDLTSPPGKSEPPVSPAAEKVIRKPDKEQVSPPIKDSKRCPKCHTANNPTAKYCDHCGERLEKSPQTAPDGKPPKLTAPPKPNTLPEYGQPAKETIPPPNRKVENVKKPARPDTLPESLPGQMPGDLPVRVYKRYAKSEVNAFVENAQAISSEPRRIKRAQEHLTSHLKERLERIECPWCTKRYTINRNGDSIIVDCIQCKNQMLIMV